MLQHISYIVQGDGEVPQSQEIAGLSFGKISPDGEGFLIETKSLFRIDVAQHISHIIQGDSKVPLRPKIMRLGFSEVT